MTAPLRLLVLLLPIVAGCGSIPPLPPTPTAWRGLAAAREAGRTGNEEEAIRLLESVVVKHPLLAEPRRLLGRLLLASGSREAAPVLAPLARLRPADPDDILELGFALLLRGEPEAATAALRRLAANPANVGPRAYVLKAEIARLEGNPAGAAQSLRHALVLDPGNPEALAGLARLAREGGDEAARAEAIADLADSCPWHPAVRRAAENP